MNIKVNPVKPFYFPFFLLLLSISLNAEEIITPIPKHLEVDANKAKLGEKLFFDKRLSRNGTVSCASCHDIAKHGGADFAACSEGIDKQIGDVNAPTVLNAVFNIAQFWDGRAEDLGEQAKGPITHPKEMGNSFENLIAFLSSNPEYKHLFNSAYKNEGITEKTITGAIAEYEKTLITPGSRFDRFLEGDKSALSDPEKEGFELFKSKGCISCHHGVNLGGNQYQRFGSVIPNDTIGTSNKGRYNVTKDPADLYYLKVPGLRNVTETAPYFHDGSVKTLTDAVRMMGYHQLGMELESREIDRIVKFLSTLTAPVAGSDNVR